MQHIFVQKIFKEKYTFMVPLWQATLWINTENMQKFWKNITLSIVNQPFFCAGYQFFNSSFKKKKYKKHPFTPNTYSICSRDMPQQSIRLPECPVLLFAIIILHDILLKKHYWCDGQKVPNKSTFVHQMHHTQSVETLQRYLILVNLSSRVQKEISAPPRVSDTEVTLLVQHSCWKTLQTYLHATHVMNRFSHTYIMWPNPLQINRCLPDLRHEIYLPLICSLSDLFSSPGELLIITVETENKPTQITIFI